MGAGIFTTLAHSSGAAAQVATGSGAAWAATGGGSMGYGGGGTPKGMGAIMGAGGKFNCGECRIGFIE